MRSSVLERYVGTVPVHDLVHQEVTLPDAQQVLFPCNSKGH